MAYKNIVLVGASGALGEPVLNALLASNTFQVTVLSRPSSKATYPAHVKVAKANFAAHQELVEAFRGQDAVVVTMGGLPTIFEDQKPLIDAAVEAGVKFFVPSEFGLDIHNEPGKSQAIFEPKRKTVAYLKDLSKDDRISWAIISPGSFFDWGITTQFFGFDVPNKKATLIDSGANRFWATTLDTVALSVLAVLSNPAYSKDKHIYVHDWSLTQREILSALEEETGSKFEIVDDSDSDALTKKYTEGLKRGEQTPENIFGLVKVGEFGRVSSARWPEEQDDSVALRLPKKDLKEETKKAIKALGL